MRIEYTVWKSCNPIELLTRLHSNALKIQLKLTQYFLFIYICICTKMVACSVYVKKLKSVLFVNQQEKKLIIRQKRVSFFEINVGEQKSLA